MDATSWLQQLMQNPWAQFAAWVIGITAGLIGIFGLFIWKKARSRNIRVSGQSQYIEKNNGQINITQNTSRDE